MSLTALQRQWRHAADIRGLRIKTPFKLRFADGSHLTVDVLLEGFGAPRGMLIVSNYARIEAKTHAIIAAGYGYSCMPQPSARDISSLEAIDAALDDWRISFPRKKGGPSDPDQCP